MESTGDEWWMDIIWGLDYEYERGDNKQNWKMRYDFIPKQERHTQADRIEKMYKCEKASLDTWFKESRL